MARLPSKPLKGYIGREYNDGDDRVYEGTSRGNRVYFVSLDKGDYEITFDAKTLTWKKAEYLGSGSMADGDYYGLRELKMFREDHEGVFEYATKLLSDYTRRPVRIPVMRNVQKRKAKGRS